MRCHYLSDLHLEAQTFDGSLPAGDILIIAGDLCHACCFDPGRTDKYYVGQRDKVRRFLEIARRNFAHVLFVAGNHEFYHGIYEDTHALLRSALDGVTVLDNEVTEIGGVRFFGSTFWTDFAGRSDVAMNAVRRRMGEFFFVRRRSSDGTTLVKFQPEDALRAHDVARAALLAAVADGSNTLVVVTHHPPSLRGLNPQFKGNGIDPAYASDLDAMIADFENVAIWIHGHTHISRTYCIGRTELRSHATGFGRTNRATQHVTLRAS